MKYNRFTSDQIVSPAPRRHMRIYLKPCLLLLLGVMTTCISAPPSFAQYPPAPIWSRGMSFESWTVQNCLGRARQALQAEGYTIDWTGGDAHHGYKGIHSALIMCDDGPQGKVVVNIVVSSNASDGNLPGAERVRLGDRMGRDVTEQAKATTWATQANQLGEGQRFTLACPPGGPIASRLWGTDLYTHDSSVCTAAVHAGLITVAGGGTVRIEMRPGASSYTGSTRNGVTSQGYAAWGGSFVFIR